MKGEELVLKTEERDISTGRHPYTIGPSGPSLFLQRDLPPAVILAAGQGRRLNHEVPKPLLKLLGLTLLERAVCSCLQAGIKEFYVVVGYKKEEIIPHLHQLETRHSITIHVVENPNWHHENGVSLLACKNYLKRPFILLMCDHVFDPKALQTLLCEHSKNRNDNLLLIERDLDRVYDLEGATKVAVVDGKVMSIGKSLKKYDSVDTGLFLLTPQIFESLEAAHLKGEYSLSGGIQNLANRNQMTAVDMQGAYWMDIDTKKSFQEAKKRLLRGQTKSHEDGWVSQKINRPLSLLITHAFTKTRLTPNAITVLGFILSLVGGCLFTLDSYLGSIAAGFLIQWASIIDGCDGELARLKFQARPFGGYLDTILDRYADMAIVLGITYGYGLRNPHFLTWVGGLAALSGFILYSYAKKEMQLRFQRPFLLTPLDQFKLSRDVRIFALFLGALANQSYLVMLILGILCHLHVAVRSFYCAFRRAAV